MRTERGWLYSLPISLSIRNTYIHNRLARLCFSSFCTVRRTINTTHNTTQHTITQHTPPKDTGSATDIQTHTARAAGWLGGSMYTCHPSYVHTHTYVHSYTRTYRCSIVREGRGRVGSGGSLYATHGHLTSGGRHGTTLPTRGHAMACHACIHGGQTHGSVDRCTDGHTNDQTDQTIIEVKHRTDGRRSITVCPLMAIWRLT